MAKDPTTTTREALLAHIQERVPRIQQGVFRSQDIGSGMLMRLKRLARYRGAYLSHVLARMGVSRQGDVPATLAWGRTITVPAGDVNTRSLRRWGILGGEEYRLILFFARSLQRSDVFYDIGANHGFYSLLAQELVSEGEVHAFEPSEYVFSYLTQIQREGTFLNRVALSNTTGVLSFFDTSSQHQSGKSTLVAEVANLNRMKGASFSVPATTLDEYCRTHTPPTVMKIDVEGGEHLVLEGGRATIEKYRPVIALELWAGERSRFSRSAVALLQEFGYQPARLSVAGEAISVSFSELSEYLAHNQTDNNFVFRYTSS